MADPQPPAKPAPPAKTMVAALVRGYYGGQLRERGDRFEIASDADLGGWMEPVDKDEAKRLAPALAKRPRPAPPIGKNVRPTPAIKLK
jgi:hypothetical protein